MFKAKFQCSGLSAEEVLKTPQKFSPLLAFSFFIRIFINWKTFSCVSAKTFLRSIFTSLDVSKGRKMETFHINRKLRNLRTLFLRKTTVLWYCRCRDFMLKKLSKFATFSSSLFFCFRSSKGKFLDQHFSVSPLIFSFFFIGNTQSIKLHRETFSRNANSLTKSCFIIPRVIKFWGNKKLIFW